MRAGYARRDPRGESYAACDRCSNCAQAGNLREHGTEIVGLWETKGKKGWEPWMKIRLSRSPAKV